MIYNKRVDMDTISSVINSLKLKKQDNEFSINELGLINLKGKLYNPGEIKIIKTYRFEGESDPAEQAIIYLIESNDGVIGYSLDAYGTYTNHNSDGFAELIHNTSKLGALFY